MHGPQHDLKLLQTDLNMSFGVRMKRIVATINAEYDVDGLCREMRVRICDLIEKKGCKLSK